MIKFDVVCIKILKSLANFFSFSQPNIASGLGCLRIKDSTRWSAKLVGSQNKFEPKGFTSFWRTVLLVWRAWGDLVFNINMLDQIFWDANGFQAVVNQHVLHQDSVLESALLAGGNGFSPTSMFEHVWTLQVISAGKDQLPQILVPCKNADKITIILQTKNLHVLSLSFCPYNIHHTKPIKVCPFITSTSTFRANYIPSSPADTTRHASSTPAPGSGGSGLQTPPTASRAICQVSTGGLGKQRVYLPEKVTWNHRKGEFLPNIIVQELCEKTSGV